MSKAKKPPAKGKTAKSPRIATPRARAREADPDASKPGFREKYAVEPPPPTEEEQAELARILAPYVPTDKVDPRAYTPNDKDRALIAMGKSCLMTDEQIAGLCGISETTLKKYYKEDLALGHRRIATQVAANMANIARNTQDKKAAVSAGKFWLESTTEGFRPPSRSAEASVKVRKGEQAGANVLEDIEDGDLDFEFTLKIGDREPNE